LPSHQRKLAVEENISPLGLRVFLKHATPNSLIGEARIPQLWLSSIGKMVTVDDSINTTIDWGALTMPSRPRTCRGGSHSGNRPVNG